MVGKEDTFYVSTLFRVLSESDNFFDCLLIKK